LGDFFTNFSTLKPYNLGIAQYNANQKNSLKLHTLWNICGRYNVSWHSGCWERCTFATSWKSQNCQNRILPYISELHQIFACGLSSKFFDHLLLELVLRELLERALEHVTVCGSSKEVSKRRAPGNGLRQFAMSVLLKVEKKGRTSYNEVADELLRDAALNYHGRARAPQVRSRIYCSLIPHRNQ